MQGSESEEVVMNLRAISKGKQIRLGYQLLMDSEEKEEHTLDPSILANVNG